MDKIEKDGKVAVLYSPRLSVGWSTQANADIHLQESLCMDARIVGPFLAEDYAEAAAAAKAIYPNVYISFSFHGLEVMWIEKGKAFEIDVYDGSETIHVIGDRQYLTA